MDELGIEVTEMLPETGTDMTTGNFMDEHGNVIGSAFGAATVLAVYELGKHVAIPVAKKGFAWVKDKFAGLKSKKKEEEPDDEDESDDKDSEKKEG